MKIPLERQEEFRQELRHRTVDSLWVISIIAFFLYPPTAIMDWISFKGQFEELFALRFSTFGVLTVFVFFQAIFRKRSWFIRHSKWGVYLFALINCVALDLMSIIVGGPGTPYYAGVNLLLLGVLVAVPWSLWEMALLVVAIFVQYDLVMWVFGMIEDFRTFFIANYFFVATSFIGLFWTVVGHSLRTSEFLARKELLKQKERSEELLLNVLPEEVANELKSNGRVQARHIDSCSILFTDFVGFTGVAGRVSPDVLVKSLDGAFSKFDNIVTKYGLEKLKTIGDAYMCAAGVLGEQPDHLLRCLLAGLEMTRALEEEDIRAADGSRWRMRIGIHPGPVVAGVIGQKKFAFDLWGDTVNTASRLESSGQPRSINLSTPVYRMVERFFEGLDRGYVPVRGKGPVAMTRVTRLRPEYSADSRGMVPNARLQEETTRWVAELRRAGEGQRERFIEISQAGPEGFAADPLGKLTELTAEDRKLLLEVARPMSFGPGQVLIEQGQSLHMLLLVVKGLVGVRITRGDVSIKVAILHPGEIIGGLSFVSWEPASATVVALEDVTVLRLDMDWMEGFMTQHPETGIRLYHSLAMVLAQRVRDTNARLFELQTQQEDGAEKGTRSRAVAAWSVPHPLRRAVVDFRAGMERFEAAGPGDDEALAREVGLACTELLESCARVSPSASRVDPALAAYVLRETFAFLMRSNTIERIHARPLGEAIDYVTMEQILARRPQGHGPLGEAIDRWFLETGLAREIRSCGLAVLEAVSGGGQAVGGHVHRVSLLAAGLASNLYEVFSPKGWPRNLQITCVEANLSALSALGRRAAKEGLAERFSFVCDAALTGHSEQGPVRLAPQHFVGVPFLPYHKDRRQLARLFEEHFHNLRPGGTLAVGFLDASPTGRFFAEGLLGWHPTWWDGEEVSGAVADSSFGQRGLPLEVTSGSGFKVLLLRRKESDGCEPAAN